MKDARDKYDAVADCEPAIERLLQGATEALEARQKNSSKHESKGESADSTTGGSLTEQDVYAAADSMEIIRDAYNYCQQRPKWRSTPGAYICFPVVPHIQVRRRPRVSWRCT
jgi:exocyst complex protein 7